MPACDDSISSKMLTIIIDRMRASYETFTSHDSRRAGRGEGGREREREKYFEEIAREEARKKKGRGFVSQLKETRKRSARKRNLDKRVVSYRIVLNIDSVIIFS